MGQREPISITLNSETIQEMDENRGYVPRSRLIEELILDYLNKKGVTDSQKRTSRGSMK